MWDSANMPEAPRQSSRQCAYLETWRHVPNRIKRPDGPAGAGTMFTGREGLTAQGIPIENPVRGHSNWAGPLSTGPASPGSKTRIPEGPGGESCRRSRGEAFGKLEAENTPQWSRMHSSPETRTMPGGSSGAWNLEGTCLRNAIAWCAMTSQFPILPEIGPSPVAAVAAVFVAHGWSWRYASVHRPKMV